jgi:hypothetical protein
MSGQNSITSEPMMPWAVTQKPRPMVASWGLRLPGSITGGSRNLWRYRIFGNPANARDRHPCGAGRAETECSQPGLAAGGKAIRDRLHDWSAPRVPAAASVLRNI